MAQTNETWDGLNWINVSLVNNFLHGRFGSKPILNRLATYRIVTRALHDLQFSDRRSKWITLVLRAINFAGLLRLFKFFPVKMSPVMDFRVERIPVQR
jgi:hypothetical protein